jgi:hypothetical protein
VTNVSLQPGHHRDALTKLKFGTPGGFVFVPCWGDAKYGFPFLTSQNEAINPPYGTQGGDKADVLFQPGKGWNAAPPVKDYVASRYPDYSSKWSGGLGGLYGNKAWFGAASTACLTYHGAWGGLKNPTKIVDRSHIDDNPASPDNQARMGYIRFNTVTPIRDWQYNSTYVAVRQYSRFSTGVFRGGKLVTNAPVGVLGASFAEFTVGGVTSKYLLVAGSYDGNTDTLFIAPYRQLPLTLTELYTVDHNTQNGVATFERYLLPRMSNYEFSPDGKKCAGIIHTMENKVQEVNGDPRQLSVGVTIGHVVEMVVTSPTSVSVSYFPGECWATGSLDGTFDYESPWGGVYPGPNLTYLDYGVPMAGEASVTENLTLSNNAGHAVSYLAVAYSDSGVLKKMRVEYDAAGSGGTGGSSNRVAWAGAYLWNGPRDALAPVSASSITYTNVLTEIYETISLSVGVFIDADEVFTLSGSCSKAAGGDPGTTSVVFDNMPCPPWCRDGAGKQSEVWSKIVFADVRTGRVAYIATTLSGEAASSGLVGSSEFTHNLYKYDNGVTTLLHGPVTEAGPIPYTRSPFANTLSPTPLLNPLTQNLHQTTHRNYGYMAHLNVDANMLVEDVVEGDAMSAFNFLATDRNKSCLQSLRVKVGGGYMYGLTGVDIAGSAVTADVAAALALYNGVPQPLPEGLLQLRNAGLV